MSDKKRSLGFTGNSLTVQGTKRVKSVEESANRIVGEPKGGMLNVKDAAFGSIESDATLDTLSTGGSNIKLDRIKWSTKTKLKECPNAAFRSVQHYATRGNSKLQKKCNSNSPNSVDLIATTALHTDVIKWVQCSLCKKWRILPIYIDTFKLPRKWVCSMNTFDANHQSCNDEEEHSVLVSNGDEMNFKQDHSISDDLLLNIDIDYPKSTSAPNVIGSDAQGLEQLKEEICKLRNKFYGQPGREEEVKYLQKSIGSICRVLFLLKTR